MTIKNADVPAMPLSGDAYTDFADHCYKGGSHNPECQGLTKREMMAMAAMQGILSSLTAEEDLSPRELARCSVADADALLAALERTK